jgi:predicted ester cyclase
MITFSLKDNSFIWVTSRQTIMTIIENKKVIQGMLQLMEKGDPDNVSKYFASDWVNHDPSLPPMKGWEGAKHLIALWSSFSNRKITIEDSITEGDRVALRFVITGTHTGPFMGIAPTGKPIKVTGTGIFKIVERKATDNWVNFDALGLLQQLGAAPPLPKK